MVKKVAVKVRCPHCNESLMDKTHLINNKESIYMNISFPSELKGAIRLSSIYGDFNYTSDLLIPEDQVVDFFCPHCGENLKRQQLECDSCSAPIVSLNCTVGGRVSFCSRHGCKNHYVVFDNLDTAIRKFYSEYEYY
jgi:predicted RNA-binding Zn-ribbon protein involved in translation (DUF1610 family)